MDRLVWTARALLATALLAGCGKTGAKSEGDSATGGAGTAGLNGGGQVSGGGSAASAGESVGGGGAANSAGQSSSGGVAAITGGAAGSAGTAGAAGVAGAGAAAATGEYPCKNDNDCGELQHCEGKICHCPSDAKDWCETDRACSNFDSDPNHCGGCQPCDETQTCNEGVCGASAEPLTSFADCQGLLLQPAAPWLYVVDQANRTLSRFAFGGAGVATPIATDLGDVNAFTLAGDTAYLATRTGVQRVVLASGAVSTVASSSASVRSVAASASKLFFTTGNDVLTINANAQAGEGTVLVTGMNGGSPSDVVVVGDYLLFNADGSFNIEGVELGPQRHFKLSGSQTGMLFGHRSLLSDGEHVYWTHDGFLDRNPFAGNDTAQQSIGGCLHWASALALAPQVFYCGDEVGVIIENPIGVLNAGRVIARNLGTITSMVVDSNTLYIAHDCKLSALPL